MKYFLRIALVFVIVNSSVFADKFEIKFNGKNIEADPAKAAETKVEAVVLEQFKGDKKLVFKFKKRKNYKKMRGHRQNLTRLQIAAVGSQKPKATKPAAKKTAPKAASVKESSDAE